VALVVAEVAENGLKFAPDPSTADRSALGGAIGNNSTGSHSLMYGKTDAYVEEVEAVLKGHPGVFDALVTGVPSDRYGERVAAVVQPYAGQPVPGRDLLDRHCREALAGYKVPRLYVFVDEVRRSPAGKADYRWARRVAAQGEPG
jgi:3-oxocholest-4-en-26-oate---CoA ligase